MRPSLEQRPARCWPAGAPAGDRAPAAGYPRRPWSAAPRPPGLPFELPGQASPQAVKEGTSHVLLGRAGLEQRG